MQCSADKRRRPVCPGPLVGSKPYLPMLQLLLPAATARCCCCCCACCASRCRSNSFTMTPSRASPNSSARLPLLLPAWHTVCQEQRWQRLALEAVVGRFLHHLQRRAERHTPSCKWLAWRPLSSRWLIHHVADEGICSLGSQDQCQVGLGNSLKSACTHIKKDNSISLISQGECGSSIMRANT